MDYIKRIPNTDYFADTLGNIHSFRRNKWRKLKSVVNATGYCYITLFKNKKGVSKRVHRLIASAFLGLDIQSKLTVNHIDGDKTNNKLSNLEVVTLGQNSSHAFKLGLKNLKGEKNNHARYTEEQVRKVKYYLKNFNHSTKEIEKLTGVLPRDINRIKNGTRWAHV